MGSPFGLVRLANSILAGCATRDTFKGVQPSDHTEKKNAPFIFFLVVEFSMMDTWRKVFKISGIFYQVLIRSNLGPFVHISILRVPPTSSTGISGQKSESHQKNDS